MPGGWPSPRTGEQSTCHEHLESCASLRVGESGRPGMGGRAQAYEQPDHPPPGSRQDSEAFPGSGRKGEVP